MDNNSRIIILTLKLTLTAAEQTELKALLADTEDVSGLIVRMIERGIGPLLFIKIHSQGWQHILPSVSYHQLQQSYYTNLKRNMIILGTFAEIAAAFSSKDLKLVALKGVYLAENLYKDISLRTLSDIDILIEPKDSEQIFEIFRNIGFKADAGKDFVSQNREIVHYPPLIRNGVSVEIHIKLHRAIEKYHLPANEFIQRAVPAVINGQHCLVSDPTDNLIHICLHLDRHFKQGSIQLSGYADIINILLFPDNNIDWEKIRSRCKELQCETEFFSQLILLHKYAGIYIPQEIITHYSDRSLRNLESRFLAYIEGERFYQSGVPNHLSSIGLLSLSAKVQYIAGVVFPSRSYMIQKYNLPSRNGLSGKLWWLWYPYRWGVGVTGLWKTVKR